MVSQCLALWAFLLLRLACGSPSLALSTRQIADGVPLRILPLGDSITWGYGSSHGNGWRADLRSRLTGSQVTYVGSQTSGDMANGQNEGHPGAVISQIADYATQSTSRRPNVVLLMAGTNDMNNPTDPSTAPSRLDSLITQIIAACPDAAVIVAKLTPNSNPSANARTLTFNDALPAIIQRHQDAGHHVLVADIYSALSLADLGDGLHPSDGGYTKMAAAWHSAIVSAAGNGWINKPVEVPGGDGGDGVGHGVCTANLYWDPVHGQVASGVGSGDPSRFPTGQWWDRKTVHTGHGKSTKGGVVHVADLDGDGKDDYVWVHPDSGAVELHLNTGDFNAWDQVGQVASGIGEGAGVRFVDINGDGKADYLWISPEGGVEYYRNGGRASSSSTGNGKWIWYYEGQIASGRGKRGVLRFADLDGDGRADLAVVGENGSLVGYLNVGTGNKPSFRSMGTIAAGDGGMDGVELRDLNGDRRADYLHVKADGAVTAYINMLGDKFGAQPDWLPIGGVAGGVGAKREDITFGDLSGDGKVDYIVVNQTSGALSLYQNQGAGSTYRAGHNVFLADITGSGKKDYLIVSPDGATELYENGGSGGSKWLWISRGQIASGVGKRANIRFGDLDGDGRDDYLVVDPDTSAVHFWQNGGPLANGKWLWIDKGRVAGGAGLGKGKGVRFADLDGDGKVDFIYLDGGGKGVAYLNGGPCATCPDKWLWIPQGTVTDGVGARREDIIFADINGDGKADYHLVDPLNGAVAMYRNGGPGSFKWIWYPVTEPIAHGVDSNGYVVRFADLTGNGRADYLRLTMGSGAIDMWMNGCSGEHVPEQPDPPAVPGDPIPNIGDGSECGTNTYPAIDEIPTEGISRVCYIIYALDTFKKLLLDGLSEYEDILAKDWDNKFAIYAKHFAQVANTTVQTYNTENAHQWYDCTVTERIYCCSNCEFVVEPDHPDRCKYCVSLGDERDDPCRPNFPTADPLYYFANESQSCPPNFDDRGVGGNARQSVYWDLKEGQDFQEVAEAVENATGVTAEFVLQGKFKINWDRSPGFQESCFREPEQDSCKGQDHWYGIPQISPDYGANEVTDPKDMMVQSLPQWKDLPNNIDEIVGRLRANTYRIDGEFVDPVAYPWLVAAPASLLNETLVSMRRIVEIADELAEEDLIEEIIFNAISLVAMALPMAAPYLLPLTVGFRATIIGRFSRNVAVWTYRSATKAPHLSGIGIAIYESVKDPKMIPLQFIQLMVGGGVLVKVNARQMGRYITMTDSVIYTTMGGALLHNHNWLIRMLPSLNQVEGMADKPSIFLPDIS